MNKEKLEKKLEKLNSIEVEEFSLKWYKLNYKKAKLKYKLEHNTEYSEDMPAALFILDKEHVLYKNEKKKARLMKSKKENKDELISEIDEFSENIKMYGLKEAKKIKAIKAAKVRRKMILTASIVPTILAICMPIALYQLFNSLYTVFDQIVSAYISKTAQGAVSALSQVKNAVSAFGAGLAAGGGVLVSRYFGAGDVHKARYASSNLFFMSILLSAGLMLILIPCAVPVMKMCQLSADKIEVGKNYFRLQLFELFFVSLNNVFIGLEKAKGNSKIVMKLNFMVMIIKIALTCLFVFGIGGKCKSIEYVEIATIIGQATITFIGLFVLFAKQNILRLSLKMILPKAEYVLPILKLSIPIFFGKFVMNIGKVTVNGMCQRYWDPVTDGLIVGTFGISNNLCGLITSPTNSFEEGQSSIVSQNVGAKNMKRAMKVFVRTLAISTSISLVGFVLLRFILLDQIVDLFTVGKSSADATYKNMIKDIFKFDSLSIIALGINASVLGLLYGFGQTKLSFFLNLSRIGSRIIFLWTMHKVYPDMKPTLCAGLSMAISNTIILILSFVFLGLFILKVKKKSYKGMYFTDPEPEFVEIEEEKEKENTSELEEAEAV